MCVPHLASYVYGQLETVEIETEKTDIEKLACYYNIFKHTNSTY